MNVLAMSDEDFLKENGPPPVSTPSGETPAAVVVDETPEVTVPAATTSDEPASAETTPADAEVVDPKDTPSGDMLGGTEGGEQGDVADTTQGKSAEDQSAKTDLGTESKETTDVPLGSTAAAADTPPDFESGYKLLMSPLKADGKTIQLKSPEELLQLAKMGVNYTRKMQELAPQRKLLMMLQNGGLSDEGKLSFAIDLVNKNPEAIKKLIKEAGIDPMDIDVSTEPAYREGNHRVTDAEAAFVTALQDIQSQEGGTDTLNVINARWDQASKDELLKSPDILEVINEQRVSGMYDRISAEVDRQRMLGVIPANTPFILAYKKAGDELAKAHALDDLLVKKVPVAAPVPVATRVLASKPAVMNGAKAAAAATTRATAATAKVTRNPLEMSDEEFMAQASQR